MPYAGSVGFARLTSLIMNVFIGVVLGLVFLFLTNDVANSSMSKLILGFLQSLVTSVLVGYAISDFVPSMKWANMIADALKLRTGPVRHCLTCAVFGTANITLILSACIFIMLVKDTGVMGVFSAVSALWVPAVVSGVGSIILLLPVAQAVASKMSGFKPEQMPN